MDQGIDPNKIAGTILSQLEKAWNASDGTTFAEPFSEDADFVTIRGEHRRTREVIGKGHQEVLDTIYRGSSVRYELLQARMISPEVVLAHAKGIMENPGGPFAGVHQVLFSMVVVRHANSWRIASFHNMLVAKS